MKQCHYKYVRVIWQPATLFSLDLWYSHTAWVVRVFPCSVWIDTCCMYVYVCIYHLQLIHCNLQAVKFTSSPVTMVTVCQTMKCVMVMMTVETTVMKLHVLVYIYVHVHPKHQMQSCLAKHCTLVYWFKMDVSLYTIQIDPCSTFNPLLVVWQLLLKRKARQHNKKSKQYNTTCPNHSFFHRKISLGSSSTLNHYYST